MTRTAYGLRIGGLDLPELAPAEGPPDVVVEPWPVAPTPPGWTSAGAGVARLGWEHDVRVEVTAERIRVDAPKGVPAAVARLPVLGGALAVVLQLRGLLVLHATAVRLGDRVVAIAGERGLGKTSLALACGRRGGGLVADDVTALDEDHVVRPGIGLLRAWPDALRAVGVDPEVLPRVHPELDKRWLAAPLAQGGPLDRWFVLSSSAEGGPLGPREAWLEGVRHTYAAGALHPSARAAHLERVARLARERSCFRLLRAPDLAALDAQAAQLGGG